MIPRDEDYNLKKQRLRERNTKFVKKFRFEYGKLESLENLVSDEQYLNKF